MWKRRRRRSRRDRSRESRREPGLGVVGPATEIAAPEGWKAQRYLAIDPGRDYTCPRCGRDVLRRAEHVVAWQIDSDASHRHWHRACWESAVREGVERYRWS